VITNKQFVNELFRDMIPGTAATLHSFGGDPATNGRWGAMPWMKGKPLPTLNPFANNYVCVSSFYSTPENKFYRRKVLFASLHCVMIDDLGTKLPMSDLKMKPSALIETSPGNFQAWLFLAQPIRTIIGAETLINEMIRAGISAEMDPGMKGVTRVARVPGGSNGKAKYRGPGDEVWPQVVHEADLSLRYDPSAIAEAYGLDLTPRREAPPPMLPRSGVDIERAGIVKWLKLFGNHKEQIREGYHEIVCPWAEAHSDKGTTGTYYMEPEALNSYHGGFVCHHGHCMDRDISDLVGWVRAQKDSITSVIPQHIIDFEKGESK
jgi:RepB DNA-primase from phage plasmid